MTQISFVLQVCVIEVPKEDSSDQKDLYCLENLIEGDYIKYNSNSGFVDEVLLSVPLFYSLSSSFSSLLDGLLYFHLTLAWSFLYIHLTLGWSAPPAPTGPSFSQIDFLLLQLSSLSVTVRRSSLSPPTNTSHCPARFRSLCLVQAHRKPETPCT